MHHKNNSRCKLFNQLLAFPIVSFYFRLNWEGYFERLWNSNRALTQRMLKYSLSLSLSSVTLTSSLTHLELLWCTHTHTHSCRHLCLTLSNPPKVQLSIWAESRTPRPTYKFDMNKFLHSASSRHSKHLRSVFSWALLHSLPALTLSHIWPRIVFKLYTILMLQYAISF